MIKDWQQDIIEEESLWEIFRKSPSLFSRPFNAIVSVASFIVLLTIVIWQNGYCWDKPDEVAFATLVRSWADIGLTYSITILGFLIAGFAIFATITKPSLFITMAKLESDNSRKLSELKFSFFSIINAFIHHLSAAFFCVLIKLFGSENGLLSIAITYFFDDPVLVKKIIVEVTFIFIGTWIVVLLLKLKSFIWNIYQTIVLSIVHAGVSEEEQ